ncbi:MAG TPA: S-layer glycoprotein N-glycosyltransferase AglJ [Methanocorpusculum sp.]|nr:S-layer glycoprotein N-glycosyltransferase AglJ [Methanocorpusculum sp.]
MNFNRDDVCVLIPTLNEKATIGSVIEELQSLGYHNILIADGQSTDGTPEIAEKLGAKVFQQQGKGKGTAMIQAFKEISDPYILMLDGDGTNPPEYADAMVEPLISGRADHTIGNRREEFEKGALTRLNRLGNSVMNKMFKWAHGNDMTDILSGYRGFTRESLEKMQLTEKGFEIETQISSEVIRQNLRFEVVPTYYKKRPGSPTKLHPLRDGIKIILAINKYGRMNNSLFYLSYLGVGLGIAGFGLGIYVVLEWFKGIEHLPLTILVMLLIVSGVLITILALISNMVIGFHHEEMVLLNRLLSEQKEKKE